MDLRFFWEFQKRKRDSTLVFFLIAGNDSEERMARGVENKTKQTLLKRKSTRLWNATKSNRRMKYHWHN